MHRLFSYVKTTLTYRQIGWIGDPLENLHPTFWSDASFASCMFTQKSATGLHHALVGPNSRYGITGLGHTQKCISTSSTEAETVAGFKCVKDLLIPSLDLWEVVLQRSPVLADMREDNQAMIQVMKTGRNPTMRTLPRVHRVDIAWLHERYQSGLFKVTWETTEEMAADIYTKSFTNPVKWKELCALIGIFDIKNPNNRFFSSCVHGPQYAGGGKAPRTASASAACEDHAQIFPSTSVRQWEVSRGCFYNPSTRQYSFKSDTYRAIEDSRQGGRETVMYTHLSRDHRSCAEYTRNEVPADGVYEHTDATACASGDKSARIPESKRAASADRKMTGPEILKIMVRGWISDSDDMFRCLSFLYDHSGQSSPSQRSGHTVNKGQKCPSRSAMNVHGIDIWTISDQTWKTMEISNPVPASRSDQWTRQSQYLLIEICASRNSTLSRAALSAGWCVCRVYESCDLHLLLLCNVFASSLYSSAQDV